MIVAAGLLVVAGLAWVVVEVQRPARGCACTGAPYVAEADETAAAFVAAVRSNDAAGAWARLTPEAQKRRGSVEAFSPELPELARRFAAEDGTWHQAYVRSQGYDTPTDVVLVLVSRAAVVSALVVHGNATREDPGRVDPDLGEPLRLGNPTADGRAPVANADGANPAFTQLESGMVIAVVRRSDGRYAVGSAAPVS